MSLVVVTQMVIIFILISIGMFLYKSGHLSQASTKDVSWIVVNVTNPITILVAALEDEEKVSASTLGMAFVFFFITYAILGIVAYIIPIIMGVKKDDRYPYRFMSIFSNVGFIGIPFCSVVLGVHSLIYVSICGLVFNLIFYTVAITRMQKIGMRQNPGKDFGEIGFSPKKLINSGTVFAVLTIVIYVLDVSVPDMCRNTLSYIGRSTTFLSMVVLGVSVAQVSLKDIFGKWQLYVFTVLRQVLVPMALYLILRNFVTETLMLNTIVILAAMPCANLPLMTAKQFDVDESVISSGIILTTILSIITIPIVALVIS